LRALVRFTTDDIVGMGDSVTLLPRYFSGVFIGPNPLREQFLRWGLSPPPEQWKPRRMSASAVQSLQVDLRRDVDALADATRYWRQVLPAPPETGGLARRKSRLVELTMTNGRQVTLDLRGATAVVPDAVRERLTAHLWRLEIGPDGALAPALQYATLRGVLYYALGIALSRDVLLRCGKCRYCGTLVVHNKQPRYCQMLWTGPA
jgi:hypothetical protein